MRFGSAVDNFTSVPEVPAVRPVAEPSTIQKMLAGLFIKACARCVPQHLVTRVFVRAACRIIDLSRSIDEAKASRQVQIDPMLRIEHESRNWSVYMTIEHLEIVNSEIAALLHLLCADRQSDRVVRIEDVKPRIEAGAEVVEAFESVLMHYTQTVADLGYLRGRARHVHPWFGPLTALQWHALAALHNYLHKKQIERILRGSPSI